MWNCNLNKIKIDKIQFKIENWFWGKFGIKESIKETRKQIMRIKIQQLKPFRNKFHAMTINKII